MSTSSRRANRALRREAQSLARSAGISYDDALRRASNVSRITIPTGLEALDSALGGGWKTGSLYIVSAAPRAKGSEFIRRLARGNSDSVHTLVIDLGASESYLSVTHRDDDGEALLSIMGVSPPKTLGINEMSELLSIVRERVVFIDHAHLLESIISPSWLLKMARGHDLTVILGIPHQAGSPTDGTCGPLRVAGRQAAATITLDQGRDGDTVLSVEGTRLSVGSALGEV